MSACIHLKHHKLIILLTLLGILCSQQILRAEDSIFKRWVRGGPTTKEYYDFFRDSLLIVTKNSVAVCCLIGDFIDILDKSKIPDFSTKLDKSKTPDYSAKIKAAENCQKNIFDRLKLYEGMDELNAKDYKFALSSYLLLLKETADLYLKIGEYYVEMGEKQKAKKIYRHIIITYTEDVFKSHVKIAEFALQDLEEK